MTRRVNRVWGLAAGRPVRQPTRVTSLFDVQINGFAGVDFQDPGVSSDEVARAVRALAGHQTLRFFVTFITDGRERLLEKVRHFEGIRAGDGAVAESVCGYHIEGPWLSPEAGYCGAHDPKKMRDPDPRELEALQDAANGNIRLVTLAPERGGSAAFIRAAREMGIRISLGHTDASGAKIDEAVAAGAEFCTHLGNGVPLQMARHDNVVQRLLARDELTAFLIPDGIHLPPFALQNLFRAKPPGRALFTTDAVAAAGAPPGRHRSGEHEVDVGDDGAVRLPSGQLAGSALTPDRGLENVMLWLGIDVAMARRLWSVEAAARFGIELPELPGALGHNEP
ncbi:MAG TPA: amidohydrolase family protein [Verrucomicrobiae bacterium]|nr:amidohydrolase family protein [Verrucomicrobiae bacterium]